MQQPLVASDLHPQQTALKSHVTFSSLIPSSIVWCSPAPPRRTARRLEAEGLPFAMVAGRKYRPLNQGRRRLAARIQRGGQQPQPRWRPALTRGAFKSCRALRE
jgi:hypothetical protein